jgi:tetratricopeptide (TPR) repeat protein
MTYDLFISYARRDNERGQVVALAEQMQTSFRAFAGRELRIFFDTQEIRGMDDWRQKIQRSLRDSHLFLAVLSPNYLTSPYCRWEWEDYVRYEAMRQCLGEGVAPVFFVTLPDATAPQTHPAVARWVGEIQHRQTFDLRPWYDAGEKALQQAHVKSTLEQLQASVRERLDRAQRAGRSPTNLMRHNPWFVGRVRELTDLRNILTRNKLGVVGALAGTAVAAVQGLGGMGKTELVLAYAHAFAWDYPGGRWQLRCENIADLRLALLQLDGPLAFEFTDDERKDLARGFERVLRELNRRERCLLVLDNVSHPTLLEPEYLDRLPRDGRLDVVATTRLAPQQIPGSVHDQTFLAVDELPLDDALALLCSHQPEGRFPTPDEYTEARTIVTLLEGFTLAVETAAIYLGRHPEPDACRKYRQRLEADLLRESEQGAADATVAVRHRERLLGNTLAYTFQTLTPEAAHLLVIGSLLPADAVALPWLRAVGANQFRAFSDEADAASPVFQETTDLLLGLRLFMHAATTDAAGPPLIVRMHRLVQELVAKQDPYLPGAPSAAELESQLVAHSKARVAFMQEGWLEPGNRWELDPLRAWSEKLLAQGHREAGWLAIAVALRLHSLARYGPAEALIRQGLARWEESLGQNHPNVAIGLNDLALLFQTINRSAEAEPLLRRALAIDEANFGANHPAVARDLNNLAQLLQAANRLAEAEPLMRRALAIDEANFGPGAPQIFIRLNNLGALMSATNRLEDAESLLRRALAIAERSLGPAHPMTASCMSTIAQLFERRGDYDAAEPLYRQALAVDEQCFGADHPAVATDLNNLAHLLYAANRLWEIEALLRRSLGILVKSKRDSGAEHPSLPTVVAFYLAFSVDHLGKQSQQALVEVHKVFEAQGLAGLLRDILRRLPGQERAAMHESTSQ